MNYLEEFFNAGALMWIIFLGGLIAFYVFVEKVLQFHRDEISVPELLRGLSNALKRQAWVEALTLCDNTPGPAAKIVGAAILACQNGDRDLKGAMDEVALVEIPRLERHVSVLSSIGFVMPLLGLLGTVLGMMDAFSIMQAGGQLPGAASALVTTAAGLSIAIFCFLGYNYLVARLNTITLDMEKAALEIVLRLEKIQSPGKTEEQK